MPVLLFDRANRGKSGPARVFKFPINDDKTRVNYSEYF